MRERERERAAGDFRVSRVSGNSYRREYQSRGRSRTRGGKDNPTHIPSTLPRGAPLAKAAGRQSGGARGFPKDAGVTSPTAHHYGGRFAFNNRQHPATRIEEKEKRLDDRSNKRSFRDLFSEKDIEEGGGGWVEVRRKKQIYRPRQRSPIIKNPCFRCGLGGHIRRFCPKLRNMRCYGCNSSTHIVRNCPVVQRPDELAVDFPTTFDISERVQSLCKFAIFRAKGPVDAAALRHAMAERYWGPVWEGKIIPIGKYSYLVGFTNEFRRDEAVLDGTVKFGGFSGTFYGWSENTGAHKVFRPVLVWITIVGLPLQCWGKEEVHTMMASFGKLREISSNFYQKTSADHFRVMMEVEDISLVPRMVKCSYKAVTDNRIRSYFVELHPSSICLPVSQCNDVNYSRYAEEGGSGGSAEEGWSNGSEAEARETLRARIIRDEAARRAGSVEEDADVADPIPADARAQFTSAGINEGGAVIQGRNSRGGDVGGVAVSAGEQERRRKGKGILVHDHQGPTQEGRILKASSYNSGSDSWDPNQAINQQTHEGSSFSSKDADSTALPLREQEDPNVHPPNEEDMDLGGEGGGGGGGYDSRDKGKKIIVEEVSEAGKVKKEAILGGTTVMGENQVIVISSDSDEGGNKVRKEASMESKGTAASVPPGFQKIQGGRMSAKVGTASPFGKLQKGGFRFLKRSSSGASSGDRRTAVPAKKTKPISSLPNQAVAEVAKNVGVAKPLTDDQIAALKSLEKERASA